MSVWPQGSSHVATAKWPPPLETQDSEVGYYAVALSLNERCRIPRLLLGGGGGVPVHTLLRPDSQAVTRPWPSVGNVVQRLSKWTTSGDRDAFLFKPLTDLRPRPSGDGGFASYRMLWGSDKHRLLQWLVNWICLSCSLWGQEKQAGNLCHTGQKLHLKCLFKKQGGESR